ncbi:MAG TPA: hypothetical protein ENG22_01470 [Candidatus Bathyarchaeota archaeon]|nr:hypothetical protein [Candidatus Bathyarchaeota archaeon]
MVGKLKLAIALAVLALSIIVVSLVESRLNYLSSNLSFQIIGLKSVDEKYLEAIVQVNSPVETTLSEIKFNLAVNGTIFGKGLMDQKVKVGRKTVIPLKIYLLNSSALDKLIQCIALGETLTIEIIDTMVTTLDFMIPLTVKLPKIKTDIEFKHSVSFKVLNATLCEYMTACASISIVNPTNISFTILNTSFKAIHDGNIIGFGFMDAPFKIEKSQVSTVKVKIHLTAAVNETLLQLIQDGYTDLLIENVSFQVKICNAIGKASIGNLSTSLLGPSINQLYEIKSLKTDLRHIFLEISSINPLNCPITIDEIHITGRINYTTPIAANLNGTVTLLPRSEKTFNISITGAEWLLNNTISKLLEISNTSLSYAIQVEAKLKLGICGVKLSVDVEKEFSLSISKSIYNLTLLSIKRLWENDTAETLKIKALVNYVINCSFLEVDQLNVLILNMTGSVFNGSTARHMFDFKLVQPIKISSTEEKLAFTIVVNISKSVINDMAKHFGVNKEANDPHFYIDPINITFTGSVRIVLSISNSHPLQLNTKINWKFILKSISVRYELREKTVNSERYLERRVYIKNNMKYPIKFIMISYTLIGYWMGIPKVSLRESIYEVFTVAPGEIVELKLSDLPLAAREIDCFDVIDGVAEIEFLGETFTLTFEIYYLST